MILTFAHARIGSKFLNSSSTIMFIALPQLSAVHQQFNLK